MAGFSLPADASQNGAAFELCLHDNSGAAELPAGKSDPSDCTQCIFCFAGAHHAMVSAAPAHFHRVNVAMVVVARGATLRFSTCGVVAVGALALTGAVNTWYLAGSVHALTATDYGHLLLIKIALFLVMLAFATINRLCLTPALTNGKPARDALRQLHRNTLIETATAALIIAAVAVLGVTPPGFGE